VLPTQAKKRLAGRAPVGRAFIQDLDPQGQVGCKLLSERRWYVRHLIVGCGTPPQLRPHLLGAEGGLTPRDETVGELLSGQVVDGWHGSPA
jgi:hypothetical protein